jgi:uncharacterized protein (DUF1697 family)
MPREFVALLRGISNVSMEPFRRGLEELGLADVETYGGTGNLIFNAPGHEPAALEEAIAARFGTDAFVRRRADIARISAEDPFAGRPGAAVLFLAHPVGAAARRAFQAVAFDGEPPILRGRAVYLVDPVRERGKRSTFDFERTLGVRATARSSRVVARIVARMALDPRPGAGGIG